MARGRKSTEKAIAEARNDAAVVLLPSPADLSLKASAVWERVVGSRPASFYGQGDVDLLRAYACAAATHQEATEHAEKFGMMLTDDDGRKYLNPSLRIAQTMASTIAQLSVKLRLSASSRVDKKTSGRAAATSAGDAPTKRPWQH